MARRRFTREQSMETAKRRLADKTVLIPFSTCHYFDGALNEHGYGQVNILGHRVKAHRLAYELVNGPIPSRDGYHGTVVRHTCDEPSCVNPAHLVLGSQQDNLRDTVLRDRQYRGERHHARKLSDEQVREIKRAVERGEGQGDVARRYGIYPSYVWMIANGRARRHAFLERAA